MMSFNCLVKFIEINTTTIVERSHAAYATFFEYFSNLGTYFVDLFDIILGIEIWESFY